MAAHIALYEIGVPFEGRPISFARREQQNPEFLAINPEGKVPTLVVDGRQMTEVAAILYYLAKRFPDAALLPKDDIETDAQAISWMSFIASTLHPARKQGMDHVIKVYSVADRRLGEKIWALGTYSIADIHLFRLYWRMSNSFKLAAGQFPNLSAHYARMMSRPAVQQTLRVEADTGYELPS